MEPAEARTVEWFTGGVGLRAIAHRLNAEQIPFPAEPTRRGAKRKGWASSAVRVILLNEKYVGRWVYGRRIFVKDPLTGRRQARLRPRAERQVSEHPDLRLVEPDVWETVQEKFRRQAASYPRSRGRLAGRTAGSPSGRASLFSGVLQCAGCGGTLVVVSGDPHRAERRWTPSCAGGDHFPRLSTTPNQSSSMTMSPGLPTSPAAVWTITSFDFGSTNTPWPRRPRSAN